MPLSGVRDKETQSPRIHATESDEVQPYARG